MDGLEAEASSLDKTALASMPKLFGPSSVMSQHWHRCQASDFKLPVTLTHLESHFADLCALLSQNAVRTFAIALALFFTHGEEPPFGLATFASSSRVDGRTVK